MSVRRMVGRGCAALGFAMVIGLASAAPVQADCVYAQAYVTREGQSPVYLTGEHDPCVAPTGWTWMVLVPVSARQGGLPNGTTNGVLVDIRVPFPL